MSQLLAVLILTVVEAIAIFALAWSRDRLGRRPND